MLDEKDTLALNAYPFRKGDEANNNTMTWSGFDVDNSKDNQQTVNLTSSTSVVRIHLCPPAQDTALKRLFLLYLVFFYVFPFDSPSIIANMRRPFSPNFPKSKNTVFCPFPAPCGIFI